MANQTTSFTGWVRQLNATHERYQPFASHEEANARALQAKQGDSSAREEILSRCLLIMARVANRRALNQEQFREYMSIAYIGMIASIAKYEISEGKFVTWAATYARYYVEAYIKSQDTGVFSYSAGVWQKLHNFRKARAYLERKGLSCSIENLMERTGLSAGTVKIFLEISEIEKFSLDAPVKTGSEQGDSRSEFVVLPTSSSFEEDLLDADENARRLALISKAMHVLTDREEFIMRSRYSDKELTLQELADHFGLTRERIRQIQEKAEEKIRKEVTKASRRSKKTQLQ